MKELLIRVSVEDTNVFLALTVDRVPFTESFSFVDEDHAQGFASDLFHHITSNRYKKPTDPIDKSQATGFLLSK